MGQWRLLTFQTIYFVLTITSKPIDVLAKTVFTKGRVILKPFGFKRFDILK